MDRCPTQKQLKQFVVGKLDEKSITSIVGHLNQCEQCEASVSSFERESDALLEQIKLEPLALDDSESEGLRAAIDNSHRSFRKILKDAGLEADSGEIPAQLSSLAEYKILSKLGEGGMGAVYKAQHRRLEKIVAIKTLRANRLANREQISRFEREMKAVGRLDHPNLIRAHDAGEVKGIHFLVMEYVDGLDFSQVVKLHKRLPVADACEAIRQAALGLQHAKENSMVHRDIKPSNLIVDRKGKVKILDMGLARITGELEENELTSTGQVMGTLDYMAPEQAKSTREVDIRADIYSLGATLYKLLAGRAPFANRSYDTAVKKLMALTSDTPASVNRMSPDVPQELSDFVDSMLAKDPDQRPSTPREVADFLTGYCTGHRLAEVTNPTANFSVPNYSDNTVDEKIAPTQNVAAEELNPSPSVQSIAESGTEFELNTVSRGEKIRQKVTRGTPAITTATKQKNSIRLMTIGFAIVSILFFAALGITYRIVTNNGELEIVCNDPNAKVDVRPVKGQAIQGVQMKAGKGNITLRSGDYEVLISNVDPDEFEISPNVVSILRGGKEVVSVTKKELPGDGKKEVDKNQLTKRSEPKNPFPEKLVESNGRWIPLLPDVIVGKGTERSKVYDHFEAGTWSRESRNLKVVRSDPSGEASFCALPITLGSVDEQKNLKYSIRMELIRLKGERCALVFLPIENKYLKFGFGLDDVSDRIETGFQVPGQTSRTKVQDKIKNGTPYTIKLTVTLARGRVSAQAEIDGIKQVEWNGKLLDLKDPKSFFADYPARPVIGIYPSGEFLFTSVAAKVDIGRATRLRATSSVLADPLLTDLRKNKIELTGTNGLKNLNFGELSDQEVLRQKLNFDTVNLISNSESELEMTVEQFKRLLDTFPNLKTIISPAVLVCENSDSIANRQIEMLELTGDVDKTKLSKLAVLKNVKRLVLSNCNIDDADLGAFASSKIGQSLNSLILNSNPLSGEGLANLNRFSQLNQLEINSTNVTDQSLSTIKEMPNLKSISVEKCSQVNSILFLKETNVSAVRTTLDSSILLKELPQISNLNEINFVPKNELLVRLRDTAKIAQLKKKLFAKNQTFDPRWKDGTSDYVISGLIPAPTPVDGLRSWQVFSKTAVGSISQWRISPDGSKVAYKTIRSSAVRIHDIQSGQLISLLAGSPGAGVLEWSFDSRSIVIAEDKGVRAYDISGTPKDYLETTLVQWHPSKNMLVGFFDGSIFVHDFDKNEATQFELEKSDRIPIQEILWSSDGNSIATIDTNKVVRIWDVATKSNLKLPLELGRYYDLAWHPKEPILVTSDDTKVQFWNPQGQVISELKGTPRGGRFVFWRPDGEGLMIICGDRRLVYWPSNSWKSKAENAFENAELFQTQLADHVQWSSDGTHFLCRNRLRNGKFEGYVYGLDKSKLKKPKSTSYKKLEGQKFPVDLNLFRWVPNKLELLVENGSAISKRITTESKDTPLVKTLPVFDGSVWSPESDMLAIVSGDAVFVCDSNGNQLIDFSLKGLRDLFWLADGSGIILRSDLEVKLWRLENPEQLIELYVQEQNAEKTVQVSNIAAHPDDPYWVMFELDNKSVRIVSLRMDKNEVFELPGKIAGQSKGHWFTLIHDQSVKLFDFNRKLFSQYPIGEPIGTLIWSPDSRKFLVNSQTGVRVINQDKQQVISTVFKWGRSLFNPRLVWSPDSNQIVVVRGAGGGCSLSVYDINTQTKKRFHESQDGANSPHALEWAPSSTIAEQNGRAPFRWFKFTSKPNPMNYFDRVIQSNMPILQRKEGNVRTFGWRPDAKSFQANGYRWFAIWNQAAPRMTNPLQSISMRIGEREIATFSAAGELTSNVDTARGAVYVIEQNDKTRKLITQNEFEKLASGNE